MFFGGGGGAVVSYFSSHSLGRLVLPYVLKVVGAAVRYVCFGLFLFFFLVFLVVLDVLKRGERVWLLCF